VLRKFSAHSALPALLWLFALRRLLFLAAAAAPARALPGDAPDRLPRVALLCALRNEASAVPRLTAALDGLEYPAGRLELLLVDDASTDRTGELLALWADGHPRARTLSTPERSGKPGALNLALGSTEAEVLVVIDADTVPRADLVRRIVAPLTDTEVGGVAGVLLPERTGAGPVARYAAAEAWVNQIVTSRAKERLGLDPPLFGGVFACRRSLLTDGRFGGWNEDTETYLDILSQGRRTRLARDAVAEHSLVRTLPEWWKQRIRWTRTRVASVSRRGPASARGLSGARVAEAAFFSMGYLDRLAFAMALPAALRGGRGARVAAAVFLATPAAQVALGAVLAGEARGLPRHLAAAALMFPLDVAVTCAGFAFELARRPLVHESPRRDG
jgi:cellulose synthase/poly-beta-1,6-N-acetylglucosamine synthase-like glycosyltransferase